MWIDAKTESLVINLNYNYSGHNHLDLQDKIK
jgi:hypothetical protein